MLQKLNNLIKTFLLVIGLLLTTLYTEAASAEGQATVEELPDQMLFQIENMKPGDWTTETYTVSNKRQENTHYVLASRFSGESKKFYNQLQLTVNQGKNTLFQGQLADFQDIEIKALDTGEETQFEFRIDFPYESGNEFQGLVTHFDILVQAEDRMEDTAVFHDDRLPNTASMIFTYLLIGAAFLLVGGLLFNRTYKRNKIVRNS